MLLLQLVPRTSSSQFHQIVPCALHRTPTFTTRANSNTVFIHPSLSDVLSPDLWILGRTFWLGIHWNTHIAIQSVFGVTLTLRQPIDRSAVSLIPERVPSKCSSVNSVLPTQALNSHCVHLFTKLADAATVGLSKDPPERRASILSYEKKKNKKYIKFILDFFSIPNFYIKKNRPHSHRYGKKEGDQEYHISNQLQKKCKKREFLSIHIRDARFRKTMIELGRTEEVIREMDKLANEDHTHRASEEKSVPQQLVDPFEFCWFRHGARTASS